MDIYNNSLIKIKHQKMLKNRLLINSLKTMTLKWSNKKWNKMTARSKRSKTKTLK